MCLSRGFYVSTTASRASLQQPVCAAVSSNGPREKRQIGFSHAPAGGLEPEFRCDSSGRPGCQSAAQGGVSSQQFQFGGQVRRTATAEQHPFSIGVSGSGLPPHRKPRGNIRKPWLLPDGRGSARSRFRAATVSERMRNYLCRSPEGAGSKRHAARMRRSNARAATVGWQESAGWRSGPVRSTV